MPEFEVVKYCQNTENVCNCCGDCNGKARKYSIAQGYYTPDFQYSVDKEIEDTMRQYNLTREDAILKLTKDTE